MHPAFFSEGTGSDVFFDKGITHKICEDYAEAGDGYIIVSDGCSSAVNTDFGSRILVRTAAQNLGSLDSARPEIFGSRVVASSGAVCRTLALNTESIRATLLVAKLDLGATFSWAIFGDGIIARKHKKKGIRVQVVSQPKNAPPYLSYCLNLASWEGYKKEFGHELSVKDYYLRDDGEIEPGPFGLEYTIRGAGIAPCGEGVNLEPYHPMCISETNSIDEYDWIALLSDGAEQFQTTIELETGLDPARIPEDQILRRLLGFKNFQGEFVQRRGLRAIKEIAEQDWEIKKKDGFCIGHGARPNDDVSIGVLSFI